MKILLVFPPLWYINISPMLGLPVLSGMLEEDGHDVEIFDINSDFMNFVLSRDFLIKLDNQVDILKQNLNELSQLNFTRETQEKKREINEALNRFSFIQKYLNNFYTQYPDIKTGIIDIFKGSYSQIDNFYQNISFITRELFNLYKNDRYTFFDEYEKSLIDKIKKYGAELIGFSIAEEPQYDWTIPFVRELKQEINTTIVLGGSYLCCRRNKINEETFRNGVDVCMTGTGEDTLKIIANKEPLENIPNIIFLDKNNNLCKNEEKSSTIDKLYKPNYNGINFDSYFTPKPILMVESSRGCYWNKCDFCSLTYYITYKTKTVDNLIEEIKEYVHKYNANTFFFSDADIHPDYLREFSNKLIKNKLNIKYITSLRLEKEFDYDLLKLMYDAGLRAVIWGVESGSDRILQLYNKGTSVKTNIEILKNAHQIGISNWALVITGFPMETIHDLILTKNFLIDNFEYIDMITVNEFQLGTNAPIYKKCEQFGLKEDDFDLIESECLYNPPPNIKRFSQNLKEEMVHLYKKDLNISEIFYFYIKILKD